MHDVPKKAIIKAVRGTVGNAVESKQTEKYSALLQEVYFFVSLILTCSDCR